MEIYEFKNMEDVSAETLVGVFERIHDSEIMKTYLFDENEYEWYIGGNVYMKLRDTLDLYQYPGSTDLDKFLGIDLKALTPGVMPNVIILDKKNSEEIRPYKKYLNSNYGTKMFKYVADDIISLSKAYNNMFKKDTPKKVIFNDPATIVYWKDGTKTVVKAEGESFDPEKGLAMAITKKHLGNEGNYYDIFREWLPKEETPEEQIMEKIGDSTHITRSFDILTANEFAERVNNSSAAIIASCEVGLYPGARKVMGEWLIPCFKTSEV